MDHKTIKVQLKNKAGKTIEFETKPFTFAAEAVIKSRFGDDVFTRIKSGERFEAEVSLADAEHDLPKLLNGDLSDVDYVQSDYDTVLSVYNFFLVYKRNAWLRQLGSQSETIVSTLEKAEALLKSLQASTSQKN